MKNIIFLKVSKRELNYYFVSFEWIVYFKPSYLKSGSLFSRVSAGQGVEEMQMCWGACWESLHYRKFGDVRTQVINLRGLSFSCSTVKDKCVIIFIAFYFYLSSKS